MLLNVSKFYSYRINYLGQLKQIIFITLRAKLHPQLLLVDNDSHAYVNSLKISALEQHMATSFLRIYGKEWEGKM